jgi:precorrin-2 dehydrogenase/sirohydrochlorin ferrochelatase
MSLLRFRRIAMSFSGEGFCLKYYPISLDISNKRCTVIGGGDVAERKVRRLLDCGARVTVVGKRISPKLKDLKARKRIEHIASDYRSECVSGSFIVIGATDNIRVNGRIYRDAKKEGILVNIADDPEHCDFILPSLLERGDLTISVSTGGKSPALARKLRMELEGRYGHEYEILIRIMGMLRKRVIRRGHSSEENRELFEAVVNSNILEKIRAKDWDGVRKRIKELTGEVIVDFITGE